jgi:hypothetical protein
MKNKSCLLGFLLVLMCFISTSVINARSYSDSLYIGEARRGQFLLSVGIGFIEGVGVNINMEYGLLGNRKTGALMAGLFGSGMWGAVSHDRIFGVSIPDTDRAYYTFGFRTAYRYELLHRLEIYMALWTGMIYLQDYMVSADYSYDYWDSTGLSHHKGSGSQKYSHNEYMWQGGGYLGFRYHFSNIVGLYIEGGYGVPVISGGLALSL